MIKKYTHTQRGHETGKISNTYEESYVSQRGRKRQPGASQEPAQRQLKET